MPGLEAALKGFVTDHSPSMIYIPTKLIFYVYAEEQMTECFGVPVYDENEMPA